MNKSECQICTERETNSYIYANFNVLKTIARNYCCFPRKSKLRVETLCFIRRRWITLRVCVHSKCTYRIFNIYTVRLKITLKKIE